MHRNFFGAQIHSFEVDLTPPDCVPEIGPEQGDFRSMFIRGRAGSARG